MGTQVAFYGCKYNKGILGWITKSFIKLLVVPHDVPREEWEVLQILETSQTIENICRIGVSYKIAGLGI